MFFLTSYTLSWLRIKSSILFHHPYQNGIKDDEISGLSSILTHSSDKTKILELQVSNLISLVECLLYFQAMQIVF